MSVNGLSLLEYRRPVLRLGPTFSHWHVGERILYCLQRRKSWIEVRSCFTICYDIFSISNLLRVTRLECDFVLRMEESEFYLQQANA